MRAIISISPENEPEALISCGENGVRILCIFQSEWLQKSKKGNNQLTIPTNQGYPNNFLLSLIVGLLQYTINI